MKIINDLADIKLLNKFHKIFFKLTNLYITFVDTEGKFITKHRSRRPFCMYLSKLGFKNKCDKNNIVGCNKFLKTKTPHIYRCYAGLGEIIAPIYVRGKLLGAVLTGQIRVKNFADKFCIEKNKYNLTEKQYKKLLVLFNKVPILTKKEFVSAAKFLYLIINYIFEKQYELLVQEKEFITHAETLVEKAKQYIKSNVHKKITLKEISDYLNVSQFYFSHLFKNKEKISFKKFVLLTKLEMALNLLKNKNLTIREISEKLGFDDWAYFSKLFKKVYNIKPTDYREKIFRKKLSRLKIQKNSKKFH